MREEGTVVGVQGHLVRVRMKPGPDCGTCCACSVLGGGQRELEFPTDKPVSAGDRVLVDIGPTSSLLSTLLLFVLPLIGLVAGVIIGDQWRPLGSRESSSLVLGFGLVALLYAFAAILDRAWLRKRQPQPTIVEVLPPATQPSG
jgi:positive regulator of sigma E activity